MNNELFGLYENNMYQGNDAGGLSAWAKKEDLRIKRKVKTADFFATLFFILTIISVIIVSFSMFDSTPILILVYLEAIFCCLAFRRGEENRIHGGWLTLWIINLLAVLALYVYINLLLFETLYQNPGMLSYSILILISLIGLSIGLMMKIEWVVTLHKSKLLESSNVNVRRQESGKLNVVVCMHQCLFCSCSAVACLGMPIISVVLLVADFVLVSVATIKRLIQKSKERKERKLRKMQDKEFGIEGGDWYDETFGEDE